MGCSVRREHRKSEGERLEEALWMPSVRVYAARLEEERRLAWCDHHRRLQRIHQGLADEHAAKLEKLENGHEERNGHHGD
jgi:hypothetical protein